MEEEGKKMETEERRMRMEEEERRNNVVINGVRWRGKGGEREVEEWIERELGLRVEGVEGERNML